MTCCGRGLRSGGGGRGAGGGGRRPGRPLRVAACARGPRVSPAGPPEEGSALRHRVRAPGAPGAAPDGAAEGWGARARGGAGSLPFLQAVAPRSCQKIRRGWKLATGVARRARRAAGAGRAPEGPAHGASFLRVARAVECQPSYFKPFTEENPGPNRRQLLALPLQSFLWTRGATAERPRGWKSGSAPGGGRDWRGPGGQTGEGRRGGGGGSLTRQQPEPSSTCGPGARAPAREPPPSPRLSPPDAGAHARQRGPLPRDGRRNECPQTLSGKASPAAAPEDRGLRPAKQCRH